MITIYLRKRHVEDMLSFFFLLEVDVKNERHFEGKNKKTEKEIERRGKKRHKRIFPF